MGGKVRLLTTDREGRGGIPEVLVLRKKAGTCQAGFREGTTEGTNGIILESPLWYTCSRRYGIGETACENSVCQSPRPKRRANRPTHVEGASVLVQLNEYSDQLDCE